MKTFYTATHRKHAPESEFEGGRLVPMPEVPERVEAVRARIEERGLGPICAPAHFGMEPILRVHRPEFVEFLVRAHEQWEEKYGAGAPDAIPSAWPARSMRDNRAGDIEARLGSFAFDTATPIAHGTWDSAQSAVDVALSAAQCMRGGDRAAFALTRPPGHHAGAELYGGYCYLNNVAIAAQWLADTGARCAILDVDYHHGNGTQSTFYARSDVFYCSLHADPAFAFPHFTGFADERGEGAGEGANFNLPLPSGTDWSTYERALGSGLDAIAAFGPDFLFVSLGLDTFENDPISDFRLRSGDYLKIGEAIARLNKPTLFALEGGYDLASIGINAVNALEGFAQI
ncbi:MAG TPA: histone deacetylase family protein [Rhizomicrobium sp.]|jgi:acetoin utilization deacetylase AcuC-like enzyme